MVGVEVRTKHNIDIRRRYSGLSETIEIWRFELMKGRIERPVLVIASTGVDKNGLAPGFYQPGMIAHPESVVIPAIVLGSQPIQMPSEYVAIHRAEEALERHAPQPLALFYPPNRRSTEIPDRRHVISFRSP